MSDAEFSVRRFQPQDREAWVTLWHDYTGTYEPTAVSPAVLESNWQAIIADDERLHALALCSGQEVIGFALYVFYYSTKSVLLDCYLIDLYVAPNHRKQGGGKYLMESLIKEGKEKKLYRITWIAQGYNADAQNFYAKIAQSEQFMRYKIVFEKKQP